MADIDRIAREGAELAGKATKGPWRGDRWDGTAKYAILAPLDPGLTEYSQETAERWEPVLTLNHKSGEYGFTGHKDGEGEANERLTIHAGTHYAALCRAVIERGEEVERLRAEKDGAYRERDALVSALSKLFPSSLGRHSENEAWDDDWRWIVFVNIPQRTYLTHGDQRNGPGPHFRDDMVQLSWHIHDSELPMFAHLQRDDTVKWDGHSTPEKYERLAALRAQGTEVEP